MKLGNSGRLQLAAAFCVMLARAHAATYFIDFLQGNDANSGTSTNSPFKRCPGDSEATSNCALINLQAGDTARFKGGVPYIGQITVARPGSASNYVRYDGNTDGSWGSGRAAINLNSNYYHAFYAPSATPFIKILN